MSHLSGTGRSAFESRWRKTTLSQREKRALKALESSSRAELITEAHRVTEDLKRVASGFQKARYKAEASVVRFDIDSNTGKVHLELFDAHEGAVELELSTDEVAKGLQSLEETETSEVPLSKFFAGEGH